MADVVLCCARNRPNKYDTMKIKTIIRSKQVLTVHQREESTNWYNTEDWLQSATKEGFFSDSRRCRKQNRQGQRGKKPAPRLSAASPCWIISGFRDQPQFNQDVNHHGVGKTGVRSMRCRSPHPRSSHHEWASEVRDVSKAWGSVRRIAQPIPRNAITTSRTTLENQIAGRDTFILYRLRDSAGTALDNKQVHLSCQQQ